MLADQGGVCAICHNPPPPDKRLHLDHCHTSARVRGLLCAQCNWYLGKIDADPTILRRLRGYINESE